VTASFFFLSIFTTEILALAPSSQINAPALHRDAKIQYMWYTDRLRFADEEGELTAKLFAQRRNIALHRVHILAAALSKSSGACSHTLPDE
jgi:hypothetical protein